MTVRFLRFCLLLLVTIFAATSATNAQPLVTSKWLKENLIKPDIVILETQPLRHYQRAHIPGSFQTDYNRWRMTDDSGLRKMLPKPELLESLIGEHGISHQSHVIIAPIGRDAGDLAAAARIYWSLYVAGLDNISILEKGLLGWYETFGMDSFERGINTPEPKEFKLALRQEQLMPMKKVEDYIAAGFSIVDARSKEEFIGQVSGGANERPGALPKSVNLPYDSLMNPDGSDLLELDQIKQLFRDSGAKLSGPQVSYCHTGHRTSLTWFVAHELLENKEARLYDGSTLEWSTTENQPLITSIKKKKQQ